MAKLRGLVRALGALVVIALVFLGGIKMAPYLGFLGFNSKKVTTDTTTITNSFSDIAELATESYLFTEVGKYSEQGTQIFGMEVPGTGASFLITYSGEVKAGITNISAIKVERDESKKTIKVTVPAAQVISTKIDPSSVKTYDQTFSLANRLEVNEVTGFIANEEKRASEEAVKRGLLEKAQKRLDEIVTGHVKAVLGDEAKDYEVRVAVAESKN